MKLRLFLAVSAALAAGASPALAQRVISEGMSGDQVRSVFGAPATVRTTGDWQYWYYHNGCPNRCGSDDVVFFREGRVVAAVLRTQRRRFSGPRANDALERYDDAAPASGGIVGSGQEAPVRMEVVRRPRPDAAAAEDRDEPREPVRVGGVRVEPGSTNADGTPRTTIIRSDDAAAAPGARPRPTNTREIGAVRDSATGAPATAVDDERREREGRVEPNTVRTSPDTMNADRRNRERAVQPRVVPRGNP
ncbi:MAG TPA: hypothetical protein VFR81_11015 [Longimicrobium sp.]|nr:hypothetical protein [Longimicrobium sp.]